MVLADILEKRKLKASRKDDCLYSFYEKNRRAIALVNFAEKSKSRKIISESRRQFIIAVVTALEVYISDIVTELVDRSPRLKGDLDSLSTSKYSLEEVYLIKKEKITIGELVVLSNNFQNLNVVGNLFSVIFRDIDENFNFFEFLKTHRFFYKNTDGKEVSFKAPGNIFKELDQILQDRHRFVHDVSFKNTPPYSYLANSREVILNFVHCIEILSNTVTKKRINRFEKIK